MTAGIIHTTQTAQPDSGTGDISANAWNAAHTINAEFNVPVVSAPATPTSGMNIYTMSPAGRSMLVGRDPNGFDVLAQPLFGSKHVMTWMPCPGQAGLSANDGTAPSAAGTNTARTADPTVGTMFAAAARTGNVSATAAGSVAGWSTQVSDFLFRGGAAGIGGFFVVWRFGVSDAALVSTAQMFVGVGARANSSTVNPSTLTNLIGVGCDSGDTNLQLYCAGATAQARVDLGVNFPANTISTDWYELVLFAPPNGTSVGYKLTRRNTGNVTSGTLSTNLPTSTTKMIPRATRANGTTASAVGIDVGIMYCETEN